MYIAIGLKTNKYQLGSGESQYSSTIYMILLLLFLSFGSDLKIITYFFNTSHLEIKADLSTNIV